MPRARKPAGPSTQGGHGAQPIREMSGQPYGDRQAAVESQQAVPIPEVSPPGAQGSPSPPGAGPAAGDASGPTAGPVDPQARLQAAMQAARNMRPQDPLFGASKRPGEPITVGMPMGIGAGPETLRTGDRVARTLRLLADVSGDARFQQLADIAAQRGR